MSLLYQEFRKKVLDELRVEMPELRSKQKAKIISERWKQHKLTNIKPMDVVEIGKTFLERPNNDIAEICLCPSDEENLRSLKYAVESLTETVFLQLEYEGENLVLQLLNLFMKIRPSGDRFLIGFVRRFVACGETLYSLRFRKNKFDIIDLINFYQRSDLIHCVLSGVGSGWLKDASVGKKSATMGLLFTLFDRDKEMTRPVMNLTQQFILDGLDPNLEIGDVICGATVTTEHDASGQCAVRRSMAACNKALLPLLRISCAD
jgi:hypothetical protein